MKTHRQKPLPHLPRFHGAGLAAATRLLGILMVSNGGFASAAIQNPAAARVITKHEPMALEWKIAIGFVIALVLVSLAIGLYFAARRWHSSNLFDRKYRFPPVPHAPLRLGGSKSGGCMATIVFDPRIDQAAVSSQKPGEKPLR